MKKYAFSLKTDEDVIIIDSLIDNYPVRLAVDTAATQTVIDLNMLLMIGYTAQDGEDWVELETSNFGLMIYYKKRLFATLPTSVFYNIH